MKVGGGGVSSDRASQEKSGNVKKSPRRSLSASDVPPRRKGKNLIIKLLKISLLAEVHLHV